MNRSNWLTCTSSIIAIAFAMSSAGSALAQNTDGQDQASGSDVEVDEVIVTGSRVATGATAPTPVTAVTPEMINQVEMPNIADAITQLPALRGSVSSSRGGQGTTVGSALNLRNLGAFRTLVLVDGKRFVTTPQFGASQSQAVNIDSIPQGLIKRVDTVTGGASAAYGSDAVAGVVNFVLDQDFEGLKAEVGAGQTSRGDGKRYNAEVTGGAAFAEGRGHVLANFEFSRSEGIDNDVIGGNPARPFQSEGQTLGRESISGQLRLVQGARLVQVPLNGLIVGCVQGVQRTTACPVYGTTFNDAGTLARPYDFGVRNAATSVFAVGGEGYLPGGQSVLDTPSTRNSTYARVSYDITPTLNAYVDVLSARTQSDSEAGSGTPSLITGSSLGIPIGLDYQYLPDALRTQMVDAGITSINLQKMFAFNVQQGFESRTNRVVFGLSNQFNDNWSGELYYTYGEVDSVFTLNNFTNTIALKNALATVRDVNNNIVCASGSADGCVPLNIFGREPLTAAQQAYLNPTDYYFTNNNQQVVEATINGALFDLPAGAVDVAFGAGYRKEALDRTSDALGLASKRNPYNNNPGALIYLNNPAIVGSLELWEVFGEAQVPLLEGLPFAQSLELNLAARYTNYSTSGGVETWKAGLVYVPVEGVRVRGALSRDVRAANLVELFSPESTGFASVRDPQRGGASVSIIPITSGNIDLTPEEADTFTLGVVLRPSFLPSVYASIDYFSIEVAEQIATLNSQRTLDLCSAGQTEYCTLISRNPTTGDITTIRTPFLNLAESKSTGVDVELGYNTSIGRFGLDGDFSTQFFGTYVMENSTTTAGSTPLDVATQAGRFQALMTAQYTTGPWTLALQEHFVGGGRFNVQDPRYAGDKAKGQYWTDIAIRRTIGDWQVFGTVQNVFDKDPPNYPFTAPSSGFGTSNIFDTQGRRYMIGTRVKL